MIFNFAVKTRLVHGIGALRNLPAIIREIGLAHPLIVTDPVIGKARFFAALRTGIEEAKIAYSVFDQCAVDARLAQVDAQAARIRADKIDGIIAVGGGSVMGAAKGMAIVATNASSFREVTGFGNFRKPALPMIMVPTTAGSGSEVSQVTVVKDDERHVKLVSGGPLSFPAVAILDPVTLESLPPRLAAISAVDALTHACEGYLSKYATPLTDALALGAIDILVRSIPPAVVEGDVAARAENLLGSAMANMVSGNARVGLAHSLSLSLEAGFGLPHGIGVGVLMPRVVAFNAPAAAPKLASLARAFGADPGKTPAQAADAIVAAFFRLYATIGFAPRFDNRAIDRNRLREMAEMAVPDILGLAPPPATIGDETPIGTTGLRGCTVREAVALYQSCF